MKLEQLIHVVEVANTQSISKAASNLFLSQPGLSSSVKQLECELGTDLFIRNKKGVELTEIGSNFVVGAKKILEQVDSLEKLCKSDATQIYNTLSVAAGHFRFAGAAVAMLLNCHKNDNSRFVIRNGINKDCIDWVAEGICDVGLVYIPEHEEKEFQKMMQHKQLQYQQIYQTTARMIIGKGHPLFHTDITEIDASELLKYPMIGQDQTTAKDYFRSVFMNTQYNNLRVLVTGQAAMYDILEFTDGYFLGFCNDIVYQNIPRQPNTREIRINSNQTTIMNVGWIASAGSEYMPLAKEFIHLITKLCTQTNFKTLSDA